MPVWVMVLVAVVVFALPFVLMYALNGDDRTDKPRPSHLPPLAPLTSSRIRGRSAPSVPLGPPGPPRQTKRRPA